MADLFTPTDLAGRLHKDESALHAGAVAVAQRWAAGRLRSATGLTEFPAVIPDDLFGWALDLGVIVYENPAFLEELRVGGVSERYGLVRLQVEAILDEARAVYGTANTPAGQFPEIEPWPDPPAVCLS